MSDGDKVHTNPRIPTYRTTATTRVRPLPQGPSGAGPPSSDTHMDMPTSVPVSAWALRRSRRPGRQKHPLTNFGAAGLALLAITAAPVPTANAARDDYVGPSTCGGCHPRAYADWQLSAHARAGQSLGPRPAAQCLFCHTTGDAPAGRAFFAAVTCEACHGPGAGYAADDIMRDPPLSRALGLRDLSTPETRATLCRTCHRAQTRILPFDSSAFTTAADYHRATSSAPDTARPEPRRP